MYLKKNMNTLFKNIENTKIIASKIQLVLTDYNLILYINGYVTFTSFTSDFIPVAWRGY